MAKDKKKQPIKEKAKERFLTSKRVQAKEYQDNLDTPGMAPRFQRAIDGVAAVQRNEVGV